MLPMALQLEYENGGCVGSWIVKQTQLLSGLVRCGECGGSGFAYRVWVRSRRKAEPCIVHRTAYKCTQVDHCRNPEVKAALVEGCVFAMIQETMPTFFHTEWSGEQGHDRPKGYDTCFFYGHFLKGHVNSLSGVDILVRIL